VGKVPWIPEDGHVAAEAPEYLHPFFLRRPRVEENEIEGVRLGQVLEDREIPDGNPVLPQGERDHREEDEDLHGVREKVPFPIFPVRKWYRPASGAVSFGVTASFGKSPGRISRQIVPLEAKRTRATERAR